MQFWRNSVWTSFAYFLGIASFVIVGFVMPYSLSYIVNGNAEIVSVESTGLQSAALAVNMLCAIVAQEAWGRGGTWFGRQRAMMGIASLWCLGAVAGLMAQVMGLSGLWIVSAALTGVSSALFATSSSYCADMSTAENAGKANAMLTAMGAFGTVAGLVIPVVCNEAMHISLSIATAFALLALLVYALAVPDVSPPLEKRSKPSRIDVCQAFLVCSMYKSFLTQTRYTQLLLGTLFCIGASFGCMRVWIVSFGMLHFGISVQLTGTLMVTFFGVSGLVILVSSRFLPTKRGCSMLLWTTVLFGIICMMGPGTLATLCIAFLFSLGDGIAGSFLNAMYFGQASGKRRGELAAMHSLASKLGTLLGLLATTPVCVNWITEYETTGKGTWLTPPMIQLVFDCLGVILYYSARLCLRHQDKFGVFVLRTKSEEPNKFSASQAQDDNS